MSHELRLSEFGGWTSETSVIPSDPSEVAGSSPVAPVKSMPAPRGRAIDRLVNRPA
jgi:hypothetical protein